MLEASRLARNNSDWYRLMEICGVSGTLIADEGGVYNPREPNDRLLLGVKGTISEAELFTLRTRLYEGRWNKARKGLLHFPLPVGYVQGADGGWTAWCVS
jgi:DNA invertase Pin-like site-specific DNA recombinase